MAGERKSPETLEAIFVLFVLGLVVAGGVVGWVVGKNSASAAGTTTTVVTTVQAAAMSVPQGHVGVGLPASAFGDPVRGAKLWNDKGCSDCHSLNGVGGTDAPPLDSMRGHLSAREVADMSGQIWDHLPQMLHHFKEEGLAVPTFAPGEMADLIAFIHGGATPAPPAAKTGGGMTGMTGMTETGGTP